MNSEVMIKNMIQEFQKNGLEVLYAKCDGFPNPSEIQNVSPDVVGWDQFKEIYHLGIVADSTTISSDSMYDKIEILTSMMMKTGESEGKRLPFYLGVPKQASIDMEKKLKSTPQSVQENIIKLEI